MEKTNIWSWIPTEPETNIDCTGEGQLQFAVLYCTACSQSEKTGAVEHGSSGIYDVESRYQTTTVEDTEDWEDLVRAVVNCRVCESAIAL
jgi:hypothetical protein